jgi:hypothetical protein
MHKWVIILVLTGFGAKTVAQDFCFKSDHYVSERYMFAFSRDEKTLIYPSPRGKLLFYDLVLARVTVELEVAHEPLTALAMSKKGKWLVAASLADTGYVLAYPSGKQLRKFYIGKQGWGCGNFACLAISDDEKYLAFKNENGAYIADKKTGNITDSVMIGEVFGISFGTIQNKLVLAGQDSICIYNQLVKTKKWYKHYTYYGAANYAALTPGEQFLVSLGFQGGDGIQVYDLKKNKTSRVFEPAGHAGDCNTFAMNAAGTEIAVYQMDPEGLAGDAENHQWFVVRFDLKTGNELGRMDISKEIMPASEINYIGYSSKGKYLGFCGAEFLGVLKIR